MRYELYTNEINLFKDTINVTDRFRILFRYTHTAHTALQTVDFETVCVSPHAEYRAPLDRKRSAKQT